MAVLEMKKIFYAYEKDRPVLSNVNTQFDAGKMYAILGPSGSGKTTLLSLIGGLDTPQKGEVFFEGRNISQCGLAAHRKDHVSEKGCPAHTAAAWTDSRGGKAQCNEAVRRTAAESGNRPCPGF